MASNPPVKNGRGPVNPMKPKEPKRGSGYAELTDDLIDDEDMRVRGEEIAPQVIYQDRVVEVEKIVEKVVEKEIHIPVEVEKPIPTPALMVDDDGAIPAKKFRLFRTNFEVQTDDITEADWVELGTVLFQMQSSIQWWIGDWFNFGKDRGWENQAALIAAQFDYEIETIWQYAYVCREIPTSIRNLSQSFSHATLVAKLNPNQQEMWLKRSADKHWKVSDLRTALLESKRAMKAKNQVEDTPAISPELITRENKLTFNRVWSSLKRGRNPKREDIAFIRNWLDEVERELKARR